VRLREEHVEEVRLFREVLGVEQAIKKQLTAALDPEYLAELRHADSNTIMLPIPEILEHLFTHYGQVDSTVLDIAETKVKQYQWNIHDQPVLFYNEIEDLVSLTQAANLPKSELQIVNFGLDIIRKTGDFEKALTEWYGRPPAEHTWINFKQHFTAAYRNLKRVRGPTMRNTAYHQAHQLATNLSTDFHNMRNEIVTSMNALALSQEQQHDPNDQLHQEESGASNPSMNAASSNNNAQLVEAIQQLMQTIQANQSNSSGGTSRTGRRNTGNRPRRNTSKYCWSHGACSHSSAECNNKRPGHTDAATFEEKMGGSTYYCQN
jgi:hypothetical protein